jgi:hypothetical protein
MKKIFAISIGISFFFYSTAQVCGGPALLSEDFTNGIPANWTILNLDGNTLYPSMINKGFTGQWQTRNHLAQPCVGDASYFSPPGYPDDYLISPSVTLGNGYSCLSWKSCSTYLISPESYQVRISTTTPTVSGFNSHSALISVSNDAADWTEHSVNLSAYAGQTVYIAFRHVGGSFAMYADDVIISSAVSLDASVVSLGLAPVVSPNTQVISGELANEGTTTINSLALNWNVNNGPVNSMSLPSLNILPFSNYQFSHSINWMPSSNGTYTLKVWAENLNGVGDQYLANDTLEKIIFVNTFPRKVLVEEFTQASCYPCGQENPAFDSTLLPNLHNWKIASIKYHASWPGYDPMYNDNPGVPDSRVEYYGVSGIPCGLMDGVFINDYNSTWIGDPSYFYQGDLDYEFSIPSIFDINVSDSTLLNGKNVSVTVTAKTDIPFSGFHLFAVVIEDSLDYGFAPGTNGEMDFYQVARLMLPDSNGQLLPIMSNNQSITYNYSYPFSPAFLDVNELKTVVFIQNDATRKIYQTEVHSPYSNPLGVTENQGNSQLSIFPNPSRNSIFISSDGMKGEEIKWSVLNMIGETVLSGSSENNSSSFQKQIDISNLASGIYFLKLETENESITRKFIRE